MDDQVSHADQKLAYSSAENPVLVADRLARTPNGITLLVELAEALQASVIDQGGRMNFPWRHPLNHSSRARAVLGQSDAVLGLELTDYMGTSRQVPRAAKRLETGHKHAVADAE